MFDFRSFCSTRFIKEPQNDISCFLNLNIKLFFLYRKNNECKRVSGPCDRFVSFGLFK